MANMTQDLPEAAFSVEGMNCASCVAHVSKAVRSLPGIASVDVNLARGRAVVKFDPAQSDANKIAAAITDSGYSAQPELSGNAAGNVEEERIQKQIRHANQWLRRAIAGLVLWAPVEIAHWFFQIFFPNLHWAHQAMLWAALLTSTVAIIYIGSSFYKSAWAALLHRTSNMDTLISLGASTAYFYSLIYFLGGLAHRWPAPMPDDVYFMEASALLALISLGHWLEARARQSAGSAIRELLNLTPATALRLSGITDSTFDTIPVAELKERDRILIRPGDRVPIDGVVLDGSSSVDESMITGEPLPVTRVPGDNVIGGTINQDGRLIVRATKVGSETALAQIVQLVETAQNSKPPVQRLADQIAAVFVPVVLAIALLTAAGWYAWGTGHHWTQIATWHAIAKAACSVLVIACPCALGLAVPAALMVGTGRGAKRGILIRDIDALQMAERIEIVVLDKTGTITQGKPVVSQVFASNGTDELEVLRLAAGAEQFSAHPLAQAIVQAARAREVSIPEATEFNTEPGFGITALIENRSILVGSAAMLQRHGPFEAAAANGSTIVYVAQKNDGRLQQLGSLALTDKIKTDSVAAIAELHGMDLRTVLLTGDNAATAESIAKQSGIQEIHADVKPGEKAQVIRQLQSAESSHRARIVAMVGDGINDAPALAQSDLGIALGSGSDVAKETGGIVLVGSSLHGVATAIRLSRATMKKIRQNLFFAFLYNILAIPLAAFGLLNPLVAAAAMALSDITVLGNSLLLRRSKID
jgi:Cu+-exporting ATPase